MAKVDFSSDSSQQPSLDSEKSKESSKMSESSDLIIRTSDMNQPDLFHELDLSSRIDVFSAYGLTLTGMDEKTQVIYFQQLHLNKKTCPYLLEVIQSDRHPYTIMKLAHQIGMYIPPQQRTGLKTYQFYLQNIRYYEKVFERYHQPVPDLYELYLAQDPVSILMKFRDEEILLPEFRFDRNYTDRKQMLTDFIVKNISGHGHFKLDSNSRRSYSSKAKVISYTEPGQKLLYSTSDLLKLIDLRREVIWKDSTYQAAFSRLSLHHLRQQILEKFEQWKHRDGYLQFSGPPELARILSHLETLLVIDVRTDTGAYLGYPQIAVAF